MYNHNIIVLLVLQQFSQVLLEDRFNSAHYYKFWCIGLDEQALAIACCGIGYQKDSGLHFILEYHHYNAVCWTCDTYYVEISQLLLCS